MKKILLLFLISISINGFGQFFMKSLKITLEEGSDKVLKGQSTINFEFSYNGISVGKYASEQDYIDRKKAEYNEKEPGKGETWEKSWFSDRKGRFEPRFIESFEAAGFKAKADAQYTLMFNTTFIEPGFNVGVARRPAYINGTATLVETGDKGKVLAKWSIEFAPGRDAMGFDFDTGLRIQESYAVAGKRLGRLIAKDLSK